ncbi:MAG: cytochrome c oxidase assembly protein, partial [Gammaproteobacteria bacterium]|nr:cytochrome c oxidase assembly protein [Gammaproteobacteria bacterium]
MFGFGYALVPLYNLFCDVTGLNGKTGVTTAAAASQKGVDTGRWVTVEFTGSTAGGLAWEFKPTVTKMRVHPGEIAQTAFYAKNTSSYPLVGRAIPSVSPGKAAAHFNKTECFCFTEQRLAAGEAKHMPVRFVVDTDLPAEVSTITLSYSFFNAEKYVDAAKVSLGDGDKSGD